MESIRVMRKDALIRYEGRKNTMPDQTLVDALKVLNDVVAGDLTAAEEDILAAIMAGPMTNVRVQIEVKFRAFHITFGTTPFLDHSWPLPIPGIFAKANPNPVNINSNGIILKVSLTPAAAAASVPSRDVPVVPPSSAGTVLIPAGVPMSQTQPSTSPIAPVDVVLPSTTSSDSIGDNWGDQEPGVGGSVLDPNQ